MATKLKWGILGTGNIARALANAINASDTGELLAVGSRSKKSAEKFGKEFKVPRRYDSYDAMLADKDVQAVYISLPNHLHAEWAIRCAQAKKHILLEKPFTLNFGQAMAVVEAAQVHNVFLMEAFMYRCHPQTAKLVELIKSGAIGEVRVIQANFAYNMGQNLGNIRMQNDVGGGSLMDVGCYCLSMARLIAGAAQGKDFAEPTEFKGSAHLGAASRIDEWTVASLKFPGEILAVLSCGNNVNIGAPLTIWGSAGNITVTNPWFPGTDAASATIQVRRDGKELENVVAAGYAGLYTIEVDTVAKHIKQRQAPSPSMTWEDSLGLMRGLDRWRQEVGLKFDTERPEAIAQPLDGRALTKRPRSKMKYGKVEGIKKPVSRIVMGSMVVNTAQLPFSYALLDNYFEIGGNTIDTAYVYGGGGRSEKAVGQWIRSRNVRDQVVLIGKGVATVEANPELLTQQLLETLHRFGLDYVDLYMMHRDNTSVPVGEFVDVLNEHKKAGRIRAFGGSNWGTRRLQAANEYAKAKGVAGFATSSPNFSLAEWNEPMWSNCVTASDPESRAWYEKTQLPLFAWSSQASGLFTGRFEPGKPAPADIERVWFNENNFKRMDRVKELAKKKGVTTIQLALSYVLSQPLNIFALIGPQTIEETRTSVAALDTQLTPKELHWLNLES